MNEADTNFILGRTFRVASNRTGLDSFLNTAVIAPKTDASLRSIIGAYQGSLMSDSRAHGTISNIVKVESLATFPAQIWAVGTIAYDLTSYHLAGHWGDTQPLIRNVITGASSQSFALTSGLSEAVTAESVSRFSGIESLSMRLHEANLTKAVLKIFPQALLESYDERTEEDGSTQRVLRVQTDAVDTGTLSKLESDFYKEVATHETMIAALKKITVSFLSKEPGASTAQI